MRSRGFTLIEIAIGMAVLGLGITASLQVFGGALQLARGAGRRAACFGARVANSKRRQGTG